jgi:hypothetical protein
MEIIKYKINNTKWTITELDEKDTGIESTYGSTFRVYKNGEMYDTANGNDYESSTEAEINILLEYKIE